MTELAEAETPLSPVTANPLGEFIAERKLAGGDILVHQTGLELRVSVWATDGRAAMGTMPAPFGLSDHQLMQALVFGHQLAAHLGIATEPASA
jgi:hypothetical protein